MSFITESIELDRIAVSIIMPRNKSNLLSRSKPFEWFAVLSVYFVAVASPSWLLLKSSTRTTVQQIKPIERIHENELDPAAFLTKYVATETPVIIVRDDNRYKGAADGFMLSFINNCSDLSVPGIPYAAMKAITSLSPWQHRLASFILNLLVGIDLKTFMKNRKNISVADIHQVAKSQTSLMMAPSNLVMFLPQSIQRILEIFTRPPYLADAQLSSSIVKGRCGVDVQIVKPEERLISMAGAKIKNPNLYEHKVTLFWGGIDSSFYPLHRDISTNEDMFMDVLSGCKEFAIAGYDERNKLTSIPLPAGEAFVDELFTLSVDKMKSIGLRGTYIKHMERAWKGSVASGETLYMPAMSLHEARNSCPSTIAVSHRPWYANTFR